MRVKEKLNWVVFIFFYESIYYRLNKNMFFTHYSFIKYSERKSGNCNIFSINFNRYYPNMLILTMYNIHSNNREVCQKRQYFLEHNTIRQVVSVRSLDFPLVNSVFWSRGTGEHWPRRHYPRPHNTCACTGNAISRGVEYNININRSEKKMDDILSY